MELVIIAAVAENGVIGNKGSLPWERIPEDMQRFRNLTLGHPVIMGSATFDSLPEQHRPLSGRTNIVLSRSREITDRGVVVCRTLQDALATARDTSGSETAYVIGGGQVYSQAMVFADRLEITHLATGYSGNVRFPHIDPAKWEESKRHDHGAYSFVTYKRNE